MPEGTEAICSEKVVNDGRGYPKDCDPEYQDATWVVSVCPVSLSVGTEDHLYRSLSVDVSALNGAVLPNLVNPNLDVFGTKRLINWPPASWRSRSKGETYEYLMQPPQVAVASLVVLLYEYLIMSRMELRHIWKRPFKLNQAIYLFSRYFGIAVQSVKTYLVLGPHSTLSVGESTCRNWQLFQVLAAYGLTGALHLVLMLTVYALHLKDLRIGVYLIVLYAVQLALQGSVTPNAVMRIAYNPICDTTEVHHDVMYLGISTWITYASLILLAAIKRDVVASKAPVVKRVIRDGAFTIILLCSISTTMVCYSLIRQVAQAHMIFGWPNTITSIACCRIIMNMETLDYAEAEAATQQPMVGFNSVDDLELARLERERREREGPERAGVEDV